MATTDVDPREDTAASARGHVAVRLALFLVVGFTLRLALGTLTGLRLVRAVSGLLIRVRPLLLRAPSTPSPSPSTGLALSRRCDSSGAVLGRSGGDRGDNVGRIRGVLRGRRLYCGGCRLGRLFSLRHGRMFALRRGRIFGLRLDGLALDSRPTLTRLTGLTRLAVTARRTIVAIAAFSRLSL
ncbi:MAG: hypothetical protein OXG42_03310, partial [Chloroflexi bacterium]|nr:hypothetical protein [Chloroflexota bacterium]